jgi:hypothetical protein
MKRSLEKDFYDSEQFANVDDNMGIVDKSIKAIRDTLAGKESVTKAITDDPDKLIKPIKSYKHRYLYVSFCEDNGPDGVTRTILSFTDLALGKRVHSYLLDLYEEDEFDKIIHILWNFKLAVKERDFPRLGEESFDEETRILLDSVGPDCVEDDGSAIFFGPIKDGLYFVLQG